MKHNTLVKILGFASFAFGIIAVFTLFAPCFSETVRGNVYQVAFGLVGGYPAIPMLCVGFALLIVGSFVPLFIGVSDKKGSLAFAILAALILAAAGTILLLSKTFYLPVIDTSAHDPLYFTIGTGAITSAVFAYLGAACSLLTAYIARQKIED